ncbi:hypothetical protein [Rosistilla ulvae]|nr:hypothetical protein [Rosistilla ulvae]
MMTTCAAFLMVLAAIGCGREAHMMEVSPVDGTVLLDGSPVTEGYVMFTPDVSSGSDPLESGKSASGTIDSDGRFQLSTYGDSDGAVIGMHTVNFFRPDPEDDDVILKDPYIPGGTSLKVEVKPDGNNLEIHLHAKGEAEITHGS